MILSTHALVGAALGSKIGNPWILIPTVLFIHYLIDGFRHGEYFDSRKASIKDTWWKVALDLGGGLLIIFGFLLLKKFGLSSGKNILLGAFFSMLPDLFTLLFWKFKNNKLLEKIKTIHSLAHHYDKNPQFSPERQWTLRNYLNDFLISVLAIIILFL